MNRDRSRALSTFDRELARENREAMDRVFKSPARWAETAPIPEDPETCRWCGGRLKALMPGMPVDFCQAGCETTYSDPFTRQCFECHKEFKTGNKNSVLCWSCSDKDRRGVESAMRENPSRGFTGKKDPIRPLRREDR